MEKQLLSGYFDYNATTPISDSVAEAMISSIRLFANASSNNSFSDENKRILKNARISVSKLLGTSPDCVFFTSGGSESNNWAIKGGLQDHLSNPGHIITTAIEHPSVLETIRHLTNKFGFEATYLKPERNGVIDIDKFNCELRPDTQLVSVMCANNETGVIQPVTEIAKITKERNIKFHVDAVQIVGKRKINVEQIGVDYLSFSAHKFYGPKGIGGLYIKDASLVNPLIHGGGQENGNRSGTENLLAIIGLAKAADECLELIEEWDAHYTECKRYMIELLRKSSIHAVFNGDDSYDLCMSNTLNMVVPGVRGEALALLLDKKYGIIVSIGSACSNNKDKKLSHVLQAMGVDDDDIQSSIRVSFGRYTQKEDIEKFVYSIQCCVDKLLYMSFDV